MESGPTSLPSSSASAAKSLLLPASPKQQGELQLPNDSMATTSASHSSDSSDNGQRPAKRTKPVKTHKNSYWARKVNEPRSGAAEQEVT